MNEQEAAELSAWNLKHAPEEIKRLKAQRAEILRLTHESFEIAWGQLTEANVWDPKFFEGAVAYLQILMAKFEVLIKSGKTTMADANAHQRSMNPRWEDV